MNRFAMIFGVCCATACGGAPKKPPMLARVASLPVETSFVLGVSFDEIKATAAWKNFGQPILNLATPKDLANALEQIKARCDLDPVRDLGWGIYALDRSGRPDRGVFLFGGRFTREKFESCATGLGWKKEAVGAVATFGDDVMVAWPAPDVMAVGFDDSALPFLQRVADGSGRGIDPRVTAMMARIDTGSTMWAAGALNQEDSAIRELGVDAKPLSGYASLELGTGLDAVAGVQFDSPTQATEAANKWRTAVDAVRTSSAGFYIDSAKVTATGNDVVVSLKMDQARVDSLGVLARQELEGQKQRQAEWEREYARQQATPAPEPPAVDYEAERRAAEERSRAEYAAQQEREREAARLAEARAELDAQRKVEDERRAKAHVKQGLAYRQEGLHDKAIEEFSAAYAVMPMGEILYNIGLSYDDLKDRQRAMDYYRRYLEAEPDGRAADKARKRVVQLTKEIEKKRKSSR